MAITSKTNFDRARSVARFTDLPILGSVFFVSSVTGSATGGYTPDAPAATIDQSIGLCTANKGDVIFVAPDHAETITAASGIDLDIAGITVIGLGQGSNRPTVTFGTSTAASIDFSAANCTLKNIRCVSNIDDLASFVIGGAGGATIEDCDFIG